MIKVFIIILLIIFILHNFYKINKKEFFMFKTEQSCIDSCILNKNIEKCNYNDYECRHKECINYCKVSCKEDECLYKKTINLKQRPPDKIKIPNLKFYNDSIYLSWFKPNNNDMFPILKYIIIIENEQLKDITIQFNSSINKDLVDHYITGLNKDNSYTIKIYSENQLGKSEPVVINSVFYPSQNTIIKKFIYTDTSKDTPFSSYISKVKNKLKTRNFSKYIFNLI